jgi:O-antigen/teichoic acid export membrane protein
VNLRRLVSGELARAGIQAYGLALAALVANLVSGIVIARTLGADGRGEAVAIAMLAGNIGLLVSLGCTQAVSYRYAREPEAGARIVTAWVAILVPLAVAGILIGQLALPVLFDAQTGDAVADARIYLFTIALVLLGELDNGLLLGQGHFLLVNAIRTGLVTVAALLHAVLAATGHLTVETALASTAAATALVHAVGLRRALRTSRGFGRFDREIARETAWYGFRGQGASLANALNQRLDLMIMPAIIGATSIGLYSIAANVSLIVSSLAATFGAMLLPAAVRRGRRGPETVLRSLHVVGGATIVLAVLLALVARPALELLYGEEFGAATKALRLLLPGTALLALASILVAGLYAADRPTTATLVQAAGLVVTVVGLLVFLPSGGITAAAIVSTVAYGTVFVSALVAYQRATGLEWRRFLNRTALTQFR